MTAGVIFLVFSSLMGVVIGAAAVLGFYAVRRRGSRKKSQKRNKMEILFFWL